MERLHALAIALPRGEPASYIFIAQTFRRDICSDAVAYLVDLSVGVLFVLEYDGYISRCGLSLTTEQRDDGLRSVIVYVGLVETVKRLDLGCGGDVDVA